MPAIIDSAPTASRASPAPSRADDSADFIIQAAYENCAGVHDVRPRGDLRGRGAGAARTYLVLTWIGIAVMVAVLVFWVSRRTAGCTRHRLIGCAAARRSLETD